MVQSPGRIDFQRYHILSPLYFPCPVAVKCLPAPHTLDSGHMPDSAAQGGRGGAPVALSGFISLRCCRKVTAGWPAGESRRPVTGGYRFKPTTARRHLTYLLPGPGGSLADLSKNGHRFLFTGCLANLLEVYKCNNS